MKSRFFLARFLKIISIAILSVSALMIFIIYILKPCIYNYERYKIRENLRFPENIRNIYYVGDIKIDNPLITCIDDRFYVFESETLNEYDGCDSVFINRDDVIWLYESYVHHKHNYDKDIDIKGALAYGDFAKYLVFVNSVKGLPLYKFPYKPKSFLMTIVRKFKWKCIDEPDVWEYEYRNRNYIIALIPRFTLIQEKKMAIMEQHRFIKEFPHLLEPMPL